MALLPLRFASSSILGLNYALCGSRVVIQPFSIPYIFEYVQPENLSLHHRSCPFITGLVLLSQVLSFYHRSCPFITGLVLLSQVLSFYHRSCPFITGLVLLSQVLSFYHRSCPCITGLVLLSQVLSSHTELDTSCLLLASTPKFILFISHTDSCSADQFVCADYSCIDASLRCDGKVDCGQHGGDEDDCCE